MHDNSEKLEYFAGPLNLCRRTKQADTVMGTQLTLNEKQFDALDMLVQREGQFLSFEQLYTAVWEEADGADNRTVARAEIKELSGQVSSAGEGFMRIDHVPAVGYSFRTRWGHNWQTEQHKEETFLLPEGAMSLPVKAEKRSGKVVVALFGGVAAAAAVIVMIFTSIMNDFSAVTQIIDAEQVPLAIPDKRLLSTCMEPGGCMSPANCTGEGICADTEDDEDGEDGEEADEEADETDGSEGGAEDEMEIED